MVEYLAIFWQAKVCLEYVGIHANLMEDQHIRMTSPVGRFFGWFVRTVKDDELPDTFFCRMVSDEQFQTDCWSQEFTVAIFADQILWKFGRCRCQSKVTIVNWTYIYDHFLEILRVYLPIYIYVYVTCSLGRCFLLDQMGRNRISLRFVGIFGLEPRIGYSGFNVAFLREANG